MFRVALLSGWHVHAHEYGDGIGKVEGAELACVWDDDEARGAELAARLNVPFVADIAAVWNDASINGVIVTTATNRHVEIITAAANNGKHVFSEKALARSVAECREIREALSRNNVRLCVSLPHRTHRRNLFAKAVIDSGALGRVSYARVRNAHGGAAQNWLPERFYSASEACGGAMMDLGAHPMYLIRWLLGRPAGVVSAFTSALNKGVDDNCVSTFDYADGAVAVSETGFLTPYSPYVLEVYGDKGGLTVVNDDVRIFKEAEKDKGWVAADLSGVADVPSALTQWVTGDVVFGYEAAEGLTEMTELAYKAAESGRRVAFD